MEKGEPIVVVKEVGKNYGTVEALKEVSFVVERGEIFGLIGPDGAGKSSLFRILTTLLLADKGTAMVAGLDVVTDYKQIRTKVGYMPGRFFTLPGSFGRRESGVFCYRVPYDSSGEL